MNQLVRSAELGVQRVMAHRDKDLPVTKDSLFEHFAWVYIFFREHVFRDDTELIVRALWPEGVPTPTARLLEIGCGPGFYSRRIAARFPRLSVLGIDNSERQIAHALSAAAHLPNCAFERGDVLDLAWPDASFTKLIASRLFTVLPQRRRAVAEIFRVLESGGKCLIAEPRFAFSASLPLLTMRTLGKMSGHSGEYREPCGATVLSLREFRESLQTQPWLRTVIWRLGRYQYALCQKP